MRLIADDGREMKIGDKVKTFRGELVEITGLRPPHKPSSSGHVSVKSCDGWEQEFYPGVLNAHYE
jgi:hypothetical protein